jgi:hypothetical protein
MSKNVDNEGVSEGDELTGAEDGNEVVGSMVVGA